MKKIAALLLTLIILCSCGTKNANNVQTEDTSNVSNNDQNNVMNNVQQIENIEIIDVNPEWLKYELLSANDLVNHNDLVNQLDIDTYKSKKWTGEMTNNLKADLLSAISELGDSEYVYINGVYQNFEEELKYENKIYRFPDEIEGHKVVAIYQPIPKKIILPENLVYLSGAGEIYNIPASLKYLVCGTITNDYPTVNEICSHRFLFFRGTLKGIDKLPSFDYGRYYFDDYDGENIIVDENCKYASIYESTNYRGNEKHYSIDVAGKIVSFEFEDKPIIDVTVRKSCESVEINKDINNLIIEDVSSKQTYDGFNYINNLIILDSSTGSTEGLYSINIQQIKGKIYNKSGKELNWSEVGRGPDDTLIEYETDPIVFETGTLVTGNCKVYIVKE